MVQPTITPQSEKAGSQEFEHPPLVRWASLAFSRVRHCLLPSHDGSNGSRDFAHTNRWGALLSRLLFSCAAVLLLVAIGLFAFRVTYHDRIYPAVAVGDVNVGGLTSAQAEERLNKRVSRLESGAISFAYEGQTWTPTLSDLGVTFDLATSIDEAERLGREGDAGSRLSYTADLLQADQVIPLRTQVNMGVLNAWFDKVDGDIGNPAINAQIVVDGTDVSITSEETGIVVDRDAAIQHVLGVLSALEPAVFDLPVVIDEPAIRSADLGDARAVVQEALSEPVRVKFEDQSWRIEASTLGTYLTVESVVENGTPTATLSMDTERLSADLRDQFASDVNREPIDARVAWSDDEGLIALDPSVNGASLKATEFATEVADSFLNGHSRVEIPVVVTHPDIDDQNLDALGIETRLGRGDSYFGGGSWQRDENITVGTGLVNGTLVRPGATFSFNEAIGEITEDKGYVTAPVVVAERVGKDIGGGICQVSTTVFRAAILAGMPIVEWHPHTYRLKGYEAEGWGPGFDASILQLGDDPAQWGDFKFENFTDSWLLVEAWTSYPNVIVNIYGADTGRKVEIVDQWQSDPITDNEDVEVYTSSLATGVVRQTEWPQSGLEAGFTRVMYDQNGVEIARREFYTYFKGRGNVYEVGTG